MSRDFLANDLQCRKRHDTLAQRIHLNTDVIVAVLGSWLGPCSNECTLQRTCFLVASLIEPFKLLKQSPQLAKVNRVEESRVKTCVSGIGRNSLLQRLGQATDFV